MHSERVEFPGALGTPLAGKKWPLENTTVSLRHTRIHAEDCADCMTRSGQLDRVERVIHLAGNLDDSQRRRLLEIADRCPVRRTLHSEVGLRTTLSAPEPSPAGRAVPSATGSAAP